MRFETAKLTGTFLFCGYGKGRERICTLPPEFDFHPTTAEKIRFLAVPVRTWVILSRP